MDSTTIKSGFHFTNDKLRDGSAIPPIGEWLVHSGTVEPCVSGLHMSEHAFDALQFSPGNLLHKVELRYELQSHGNPIDKWVGAERKITATINAEKLMRDFARWNALKVLHLWPNPPQVVVDYLKTGDESLRAAARDAARAAARAAARDAFIVEARDEFARLVEEEFNKQS